MSRRVKLRDERGNTLIVVILVSMIIGALASLALASGRQADWSSASDRNHEQALGLAEAGIHEEIARIESLAGGSYQAVLPTIAPVTGPQGTYQVETSRCPPDPSDPKLSIHQTWCTGMSVTSGYVIDAKGSTGVSTFLRARHVRVSLIPPEIFPNHGEYALFSYTSIALKNNDTINQGLTIPGDIFANDSVTLNQNVVVNGSVTSAQSYIDTTGATVTGNVWSGGYNSAGPWALNLGTVGGWAKASVTAPTDPQTCGGQSASNYTVNLGTVTGDVTTWGSISGSGAGSQHPGVCTAAAPAQPLPGFTYNRNNYDQSTLHEFSSVADFNSWVSTNASQLSSIKGTFLINDPNPSQSNRVVLNGWNISGDLTVISQAPVYDNAITDNNLAQGVQPVLTIVSHYQPPTSSQQSNGCDVNHDGSECAIHFKNGLNASCNTAVLFYADLGPVAIKNNSTFCGSVMSDGIQIKNNQNLNYDSRVKRHVGFGPETFQVGRWEELSPNAP